MIERYKEKNLLIGIIYFFIGALILLFGYLFMIDLRVDLLLYQISKGYYLAWWGFLFFLFDILLFGVIIIIHGFFTLRPASTDKVRKSIGRISLLLGLFMIGGNIFATINTLITQSGLGALYIIPLIFFAIIGLGLIIHGIYMIRFIPRTLEMRRLYAKIVWVYIFLFFFLPYLIFNPISLILLFIILVGSAILMPYVMIKKTKLLKVKQQISQVEGEINKIEELFNSRKLDQEKYFHKVGVLKRYKKELEDKLSQFEKGDINELIEEYTLSLERKPKDRSTWDNLACCYIEKHEYEKAIEAYKNLLMIKPKDLKTWLSLGSALLKNGEYDRAEKAYKKAIRIDSKCEFALNQLKELEKIKA